MKFNFSLSLANFSSLAQKKISPALWVFLGLVLIIVLYMVKDSVAKIFTATDQSQMAGAQMVRVNFDLYNAIENRLYANSDYKPPEIPVVDPFGVTPAK